MSIRRAQDESIEGTPDGLNAISEIMDVPDAPTIGTATDLGTGSTASVTFTAATTGGTATTYTVTSTPGSITGTGASSPITVSGLSAGTAYTFKVKGTNATGVTGAESVASNSLTLAFPVDSGYDALASVTVGTAVSSITFAGIPTGYKHLQIRGLIRDNRATNPDSIQLTFNSDTGANYSYHSINAYGDVVDASAAASANYAFFGRFPGANQTANIFGTSIVDILEYANTNIYKTIRCLSGYDLNGSGQLKFESGNWRNTSAITSLTLTPANGSFVQYTSFALYGVK